MCVGKGEMCRVPLGTGRGIFSFSRHVLSGHLLPLEFHSMWTSGMGTWTWMHLSWLGIPCLKGYLVGGTTVLGAFAPVSPVRSSEDCKLRADSPFWQCRG